MSSVTISSFLPPSSRALHALRAVWHAIRDRLPAAEVVALGAQLPTLIRGPYYEGWMLANDPTRIRGRAAMVERVEKELVADPRLDPVDVLCAVIHLLVEHEAAAAIPVMATRAGWGAAEPAEDAHLSIDRAADRRDADGGS